MPQKGTTLTYGNRDHIISQDFYKEFKQKTESTLDYKTFVEIIKKSNKAIANIISTDPEGFKFPESLGYLIVSRYKSKRKPTNYKLSKELGVHVIHTNMHSENDMFTLRWFNKYSSNNIFTKLFKFKGCRTLTRGISRGIKNEINFTKWSNSDFFNHNKVSKLYDTINKNGDN